MYPGNAFPFYGITCQLTTGKGVSNCHDALFEGWYALYVLPMTGLSLWLIQLQHPIKAPAC